MKVTARGPLARSFYLRTLMTGGARRGEMKQALLVLAIAAIACNYSTVRTQSGVPAEAQVFVDAFSKDMAENRYEKIHNDAADEWKQTSSPEQTKQFFTTIKEKLGGVKIRALQTIRDQQNSGGDLPGHSLVIIYETTFERDRGMETFTLVERDGRWLLARYFVSSSALK